VTIRNGARSGSKTTAWAYPEAERIRIFDRGARLDTGKPGTGLGLAIVRDVAGIYGGDVELHESEDLGGLLVKLKLPRAGS
jgi:signal transduction histidine kinase